MTKPPHKPDDDGATGADPAEGSAPLDQWFSASPQAPDAPAPPAPDRTIFMPASDLPAPSPMAPPTPRGASPNVARNQGQIPIGSALNSIFVVRRFLARGGMGEVYEGINSHTDERVAIKVILPHLASNPTVRESFRNEGRRMPRMSHQAIVQYRVLADEPTLGILYIVTEFVDGKSLEDMLGQIRPSESELIAFTRRLAEGLKVAHEAGVVHRDLAPDNVLLPGGRLANAKIIDFGIAKDTQGSSGTIVGDGFAGKLGFVAPEQFGDFSREIGPWTDIYSLGLVVLGLAAGRSVDMGATLADAIERRRRGVDVAALPQRLRPLFSAMLQADPAARLRSMDEVLDRLSTLETGEIGPAKANWTTVPGDGAMASGLPLKRIAILGGVAAVLLLATVLGWSLLRSPAKPDIVAKAPATQPLGVRASEAVAKSLPRLPCSWVTLDDLSEDAGRVDVRLSGASGNPAGAAEQIRSDINAEHPKTISIDSSGVSQAPAAACPVIDSLQRYRDPASADPASAKGPQIWASQREFHFQITEVCPKLPGVATAVVKIKAPTGSEDIALFGIGGDGKIQEIFSGISGFRDLGRQTQGRMIEENGTDLTLNLCTNTAGLTGLALIRGRPPFDLGLAKIRAKEGRIADSVFSARFDAAAKAGGWKTEMAWYRVIGE